MIDPSDPIPVKAQTSRSKGQAPKSGAKLSSADAASRKKEEGVLQRHRNLIHDLNNSLMVATLLSEQLSEAVHKDRPIALEKTNILMASLGDMRGMVSELSALSAPEQGAVIALKTATYNVTSLRALLASMSSEWALIMPPDAALKISHVEGDASVSIHQPYLARIFQNVIRNATQASLRAGVNKKPLYVHVHIGLEGRHLLISLSDNGPGMDDITARRLFKPSIPDKSKPQSKPQPKPQSPASQPGILPKGQGLLSARDCAHQMGGSLHLLKTNKNGTTFGLFLPLL